MKPDLKTCMLVAALAVFVAVPALFYAFDGLPRRSVLKEAISGLTLLAVFAMLGQFFLARSNMEVIKLFDLRGVQRVHKWITYGAVTVLVLHPLLIVLPRYFEAGVDPMDALVTMLTSFDNVGILAGLIAWGLMIVLAGTAMFRMALIKRFGIKYRNWRYFHGFLSVAFILIALFHAIMLGRHIDAAMGIWMCGLAAGGIMLLLRMYLSPSVKPKGAS